MTTKAFENSDKNAPLLVACISLFGCVSADDTFSSVNTELETVEKNLKTLVPWVKMVYFIFQTECGQFSNYIIEQKY